MVNGKILLALTSSFLITLWIILQTAPGMINPGSLTKGHAKIQEQCFQCHTPFLGTSSEKCLTCHPLAKIGTGSPGKTNFHQGLQNKDCGACHSEHQGGNISKSTRKFDHSQLPPEKKDNCSQCHTSPKDALHAAITTPCSQCHTSTTWKQATINHERFFRFDRHHPSTDCKSCHPQNQWQTYTCYSCHEHNPTKVRKEHLKEGIQSFEKCVSCHRSGNEKETKQTWRELNNNNISGESNHKQNKHKRNHEHDDDDDD